MVKRKKHGYFIRILIAIDQLANTIAGGDPDETISSRLGKHVKKNDSWFAKAV
jgi:hypothetical protein